MIRKILEGACTVLLGAFFAGCGILILVLLLGAGGCKTSLPLPLPTTKRDTSYIVRTREVTDTLLLTAEVITVSDSVRCPAGATRDSVVYVTLTRTLPARTQVVTRTVRDTVWQTRETLVPGTTPHWGRVGLISLYLVLLALLGRLIFYLVTKR